jgi:hypothetical protein
MKSGEESYTSVSQPKVHEGLEMCLGHPRDVIQLIKLLAPEFYI